MLKNKKYIGKIIIAVSICSFIFGISNFSFAQETVNGNRENQATVSKCPEGVYCLLEPLPGFGPTIDSNTGIADYVKKIMKLVIAIAGALAIIMMVVGGIQYMSTDAMSGKEDGKETINNALIGLGLALVSFVLLNTLDPRLTVIDTSSVVEISVSIEEGRDSISEEKIGGSKTSLSAADCPSGIIDIPSSLNKKSGVTKICKDLADKLTQLKTSASGLNLIITSTIDGDHESLCHKANNAKSGNCADIALRDSSGNPIVHTDPSWGKLCNAVVSIKGLDFLNEATNQGACNNTRKFQTYAKTTAPHLHIMRTSDK